MSVPGVRGIDLRGDRFGKVVVLAYVQSFTRDGSSYEIARVGKALTCSCPAFGRRQRSECKHLKVYLAAESALARCEREGHRNGDGWLCRACLIRSLATIAATVARDYRPKNKAAGAKRAKSRKC